ncbi:hypothetical protein [Rhizobium leguminosarum]|uniref:hypothetical protein n=1 Tax=Rhizobium leguminosarum TaxID=384 RepID=UPI002E129DF1|nr:hypothetical protein U8Q02_40560 [Rhizobium leguminosarum]
MKKPPRQFVTDNMLRVLRAMAAAEEAEEWEDGELVSDGDRQWWLGLDVVAARTVDRLLACRAVSDRSEGAATLRLGLNGTGRAIIDDPTVAEAIMEAIRKGGSFDDCGRPLDPSN